MKTLTVTMKQVIDIFRAGVDRGQSEASAFEWGCSPGGTKFDKLEDAIEKIVNEGNRWDNPNNVTFETIREWIKEAENERT